VLAPQDVAEASSSCIAFHLADKWRNPALLYGDYLLAHAGALSIERSSSPSCPRRTGPVDGWVGQWRQAVTPLGVNRSVAPRTGRQGAVHRDEAPADGREVRVESGFLDDAETVIVAFGSPPSS
jgi:hypothetical protein